MMIVKGLRSFECGNQVLHFILEVPKLEFETLDFTFDVVRGVAEMTSPK